MSGDADGDGDGVLTPDIVALFVCVVVKSKERESWRVRGKKDDVWNYICAAVMLLWGRGEGATGAVDGVL